MRLRRVLVALSFTVVAKAQNFSSYLPDCAPPCVEQTVNSTDICTGLDDSKCLCENLPRLLFPSRPCFIQSCDEADLDQLRSEITSGWQKFCDDIGTPAEIPTGPNFGGPHHSGFNSSTTSSTVSTTSSTSTSTTSGGTTVVAASGLSTGAKAGIGVGVGIGSLAVIGGLVLLGFRLGRKGTGRSKTEVESASPSDGGGQAGDGNTATLPTTAAEAAVKDGGDDWFTKQQMGPNPIAELPTPSSPHAELPAHDIRELPVTERPVELYGVVPPELSADAEIPRDRILGQGRL